MTEKERSEQRALIEDILGKFVEKVEGQFNVITVELGFIKQQTTKTNGTVIRHEQELKELNKAEIMHTINCPHGKSIDELMAVKKNWKVYATAGLFLGFFAVASAVTAYESFRGLFKDQINIEQPVKSVQDVNKPLLKK